jgi:hypothetical protein
MTAREILKKYRGKDITGLKVIWVTAIKDTGRREYLPPGYTSPIWLWQCVCGKIFELSIGRMRNRKLPSCGCKTLELRRKNIRNIIKKISFYKGTLINKLKSSNSKAHNKLGIKGIYQHKKTKRYFMRITIAGKRYHKGYFDTIEEAVKARKKAEKKYHLPLIKEYENLMLKKSH